MKRDTGRPFILQSCSICTLHWRASEMRTDTSHTQLSSCMCCYLSMLRLCVRVRSVNWQPFSMAF